MSRPDRNLFQRPADAIKGRRRTDLEPRFLDARTGVDGLSDGRDPFCHHKMQALDHSAFDGDNTLAGVFRLIEGFDDFAGPGNFLVRRREDLVARDDLRGVDQGFAVHPKRAPVLALGAETRHCL